MKITTELYEKAKQAKNVQELSAIAKENNIELTEEEAKAYFAQLTPQIGELSDDELDNVAGGACVTATAPKCPKCGSENVDFAGTQDYPLITCHDCGYSNKDSVI